MTVYNPDAIADAQNVTLAACDILKVAHLIEADCAAHSYGEVVVWKMPRHPDAVRFPGLRHHCIQSMLERLPAHYASQSLKN